MTKPNHPDPAIMRLVAQGRLPRVEVLTASGQPAWTLPTLLGHLGLSLAEFADYLPAKGSALTQHSDSGLYELRR